MRDRWSRILRLQNVQVNQSRRAGQLDGYLGSELSKVMIEVDISMAHAFGLGHFPKHGVSSEFALPGAKALKQNAEFLYVGCKVYRSCTTLLLVRFRARLEAVRPRRWEPKRQRLQDHALEETGGWCNQTLSKSCKVSCRHLILDTAGNLYGVASGGGSNGQGVVYKLNIRSGSFAVLHSFGGGTDGCWPYGSVTRDKAGNLYGITWACGASSNYYGTIWKVSTTGQETILHNFSYTFSDGCYPYAGVTLDSKGNLYGVTSGCGANNWGALYKLSATGRFVLLHSFDYWMGADPIGEVLRTTTDTLFGTSFEGGANAGTCGQQYGCGTVWSYVP